MKTETPIRKSEWLACAGWGLLLLAGMGYLVWYENAPGPAGDAPPTLTSATPLELDDGRPTLVMYAHPNCPCTRASLEELAKLVAHCPDRASIRVFFFKPGDAGAEWAKTDLWTYAENIPGVAVSLDEDGRQAAKLGAETSGHVVLYAPDGTLMFSGGITASRGHAGDNAGRSALTALLMDDATDTRKTFVFGCSLASKDGSATLENEACQHR